MAIDLKKRKVVEAKTKRAKGYMGARFNITPQGVAGQGKIDTEREYNKARSRRETYGPTGAVGKLKNGAKAREKRLEGKAL